MRVLAATLALLVSSAAPAQECKTCSMADACMKTYVKAASEAQTATKRQSGIGSRILDKKAPQNCPAGARPHYKTPWRRKFVWSLTA